MAMRYSASQLRSKVRQIENKQRQAINQYNQAVRRHKQKVRAGINQYNQSVRAYNARVRAHRQRVRSELARLNRQPVTTRYMVYRTSVQTLHEAYTRLENRADTQHFDPSYNWVLDLSERETANSLDVTNRLLTTEPDVVEYSDGLDDAPLGDELRSISADLDHRWKGAVFALDPRNPDAARHFCTSAREILTEILEIKAPDAEVITCLPYCDKTKQGKPTRRSKIEYFLHRNGMIEETLEEFVAQDMDNILQLFRLFNEGTHGPAGAFDLQQLVGIKKRVEDGIMYLAHIVGNA